MANLLPPLGGQFHSEPLRLPSAGWTPKPDFNMLAGLLQCPQVSPILFMLFIQPLFQIGLKHFQRGRLGYADDICQLVANKSLEDNAASLNQIAQDLNSWGTAQGLTFDFAKKELQHFTKDCSSLNPQCSIPLDETHIQIQPPSKGEATRWLDIWFDRTLSFKRMPSTWLPRSSGLHMTSAP